MSIDDVISRARQPGGYSEHREFSVARERGIRKMREFALADPHYYILELFQAAVANQASHVDIQLSGTSLSFSYVGGGYARQELAQLFDYLFASKHDVEHGDIRQLAVGINALLLTEPDRVIIESGQGDLASTNRITIRGDADTVEVGTPQQSLDGTFVRAEGIDRSAIADRSTLQPMDYGPPECRAIENRCLAAPIPIIVNGNALFGYASTRTPVLYGYDNVVTFDEGDLYGSIGIPQKRHKRSCRLLTWGCWIESTGHADMEGTPVGGVVSFDRLNKTADHSGIVQDERFEELWARLRPYARQVATGEAGSASYAVSRLDGTAIDPADLREFLRAHDAVVSVPDQLGDQGHRRAREAGQALDAPVLRVPDDARDALHMLAGADTDILEPVLDDEEAHRNDLDVYTREPCRQPPRPWVTGALELDPIPLETLAEWVITEQLEPDDVDTSSTTRDDVADRLGGRGMVQGQLYTPVEPSGGGALVVRLISMNRVIWRGTVSSPYPGHQLDVQLPATAPSRLRANAASNMADDFGAAVARTLARHCIESLQEVTSRALRALSADQIQPEGTGARLVLAELARSSIKRLRTDADGATIEFDLVDDTPGLDLLDAPVVRTLDGDPLSINDLASRMPSTAGLVYGTIPEVEPALAGLDTSRILELDAERESLLMATIGEAAYVRIDRRDILARLDHGDPNTQIGIRDLAVGLRDYPDGPLLLEPLDADAPADTPSLDDLALSSEAIRSLVEQLVDIWRADDRDPQHRRQAVRHLQRFVAVRHRRTHHDDTSAPSFVRDIEQLPLFVDADRRPCSFQQVLDGLQSETGIVMVDGRSADVSTLGRLADHPVEPVDARDEPVRELMMNTWVYLLLRPLGQITGAFDFDFSTADPDPSFEAATDPEPDDGFLVSADVDGQGFRGHVGVPVEPVARPSVAVIDQVNRRSRQLRETARTFDIVGYVNIETGSVDSLWQPITRAVARSARQCLQNLVTRLPRIDPTSDDADRHRARRTFDVLYNFASRHLRFVRNPSGTVSPQLGDPLAQKIFEIPIFPTAHGVPVSALRLIHDFSVDAANDPSTAAGSRVSLVELPPALDTWIRDHLAPENIIEPARHGGSTPDSRTQLSSPDATDANALSDTLFRALLATAPTDHILDLIHDHLGVLTTTESDLVRATHEPQLTDAVLPAFRRSEPFVCQPVDASTLGQLDASDLHVARTASQPTHLLVGHAEHPAIQRARDVAFPDADAPLDESLAWCLLAAFPPIVSHLDTVTDAAEMQFQRHVIDQLQRQ